MPYRRKKFTFAISSPDEFLSGFVGSSMAEQNFKYGGMLSMDSEVTGLTSRVHFPPNFQRPLTAKSA